MAVLDMQSAILFIILGTLAAIVYSLRVLVLVERRMERIERHIEQLAAKNLKEEIKIEKMISKKKR